MNQPINPSQAHDIEQRIREFTKRNPKLVSGATVYGIHGPVRIAGFTVDPTTRQIQIEATQLPNGKPQRYTADYFAQAFSLTNDPSHVVNAYVSGVKSGWDGKTPDPLMSPDDASIAPHLRQFYRGAMSEAESRDPLPTDDPKRAKWGDSVDAWGYKKKP